MTSWKRLWGKKTKKSLKKIEQRYDQWLQELHDQYGPFHENGAVAKEIKREKRFDHSAARASLN